MKKLIPLFALLAFVMVLAPHIAFSQGHVGQTPAPSVIGPPLSAAVSPRETTVCGSTHSTPNANEQAVIDMTNQLRVSHGVPALSVSPSLERSADTHSLQMAATGVFAHDSYGATLARTQSCGSPTQSIDENIAGNGSGDPTATFNQYVNSPPHLANLLDANMVSVGVSFEEGIYNDGTTTWPNFWMNTMTFASTADSSTPTPQPTPSPTRTPTPTPAPTGLVAPTVSLSTSGLTATFTVTGQATVPYYAVAYGDGTSASWQQGHVFSHTYTSAGTYGAVAWVGDGSTGQISPARAVSVTVGSQPTPQPTPSPTPQPNVCRQAYFLNGALAQGGVISCPS
jgi:uncharacterized protein YkwD